MIPVSSAIETSIARESSATRQRILLFSPILVILICQITARIVAPLFGDLSIYPWLLVYWAVTGGLILWAGGPAAIRRWAGKPRGSWLWSALALLLIPLTFPIFLDGWQLLQSGWLWLPWLLFPPINSLFEEGYWRGLLYDTTRRWPGWAIIVYSSLFFALNHLSLGVFIPLYRSPFSIMTPIMAGLVFGVVYSKTGSLRWVILSHTIVNWLSLGILVLLNIYVPVTP